jgi:hypothetical protein
MVKGDNFLFNATNIYAKDNSLSLHFIIIGDGNTKKRTMGGIYFKKR